MTDIEELREKALDKFWECQSWQPYDPYDRHHEEQFLLQCVCLDMLKSSLDKYEKKNAKNT